MANDSERDLQIQHPLLTSPSHGIKIDRLPDELLAQIFQAVTYRGDQWFRRPQSYFPHPSQLDKPLLVEELHQVVLVCKRWRAVAGATGRLSKLDLFLDHRLAEGPGSFKSVETFISCIKRVVANLGGGNLHLIISFPTFHMFSDANPSKSWIVDGIRNIQPVVAQIASIRLTQEGESIYNSLSTITQLASLSRLEELEIQDASEWTGPAVLSLEGQRTKLDFSQAPNLWRLKVRRLDMTNLLAPISQLQELTMPVNLSGDGDWTQFLTFLSSCHSVIKVDLTIRSDVLDSLELLVPDTKLPCLVRYVRLSIPERIVKALLLALNTSRVENLSLEFDAEGIIHTQLADIPIFPIARNVHISFQCWGVLIDNLLSRAFPSTLECLAFSFLYNAYIAQAAFDTLPVIKLPQADSITLEARGQQPSWRRIISRWSTDVRQLRINSNGHSPLRDSRNVDEQFFKLPSLETLHVDGFGAHDMNGLLASIDAPHLQSVCLGLINALPDLLKTQFKAPPAALRFPTKITLTISVVFRLVTEKNLLLMFPCADEITFLFAMKYDRIQVDNFSASIAGMLLDLQSRTRPLPRLQNVNFVCQTRNVETGDLHFMDVIKDAIVSTSKWRSSRKVPLPKLSGVLRKTGKNIHEQEVVWSIGY
jgi:hypothetical protein